MTERLLTENQAAEVAARHGLDPDLGRELLAGQDRAKAEAFAAATAATREPVPAGEIEMLAEHTRRKHTATLAALGIHDEQPSAEDGSDGDAVDWDGGARQPAPSPGDPEQAHNTLLSGLLAAKRNGRR